jgi:predicted fused transcriptional regulator/phosphomethylpyrimidine kinase
MGRGIWSSPDSLLKPDIIEERGNHEHGVEAMIKFVERKALLILRKLSTSIQNARHRTGRHRPK